MLCYAVNAFLTPHNISLKKKEELARAYAKNKVRHIYRLNI
jgi:hypothetical protein